MHLVIIAPRLTKPFRDELKILGLNEQEEEVGVWRVREGCVGHPLWVLETEVLAGLNHPLLSVVSPQFLGEHPAIYNDLSRAGYRDLVVYVAQQVVQFRSRGKEFSMVHVGADTELREALADMLKSLPPDDLLEVLTVKDRLKGLPVEDRLEGLPVEDVLRALSPEDRNRMRKLLEETDSSEPEK
jgi:hypothetical protein